MSPEKQGGILLFSPRRESGPVTHRIGSPSRGLVHVAGGARIRNLVLIRHGWRDEGERVRTYEDAWNRNFHLRHVAGHTLAPRRAVLVVRVLRQGRFARTVARTWPVAIEANFIHRFAELGVVLRAMHVVAIEARHSTPVHHALHEVVPLHPIFMRRAVGEMSK